MSRGGYRAGAGGSNKTKQDITKGAVAAKMQPLEYMLMVMNDPAADVTRRDRMAIAAAPFVHPREIDAVKGKKKLAAEKAVDMDASLVAELEQEAANQNAVH